MSYILEALKKAEAERHTGVPHTAPTLPRLGAPDHAGSEMRKKWLWAALPVSALALAFAAWLATRDSAPPATPPTPTAPPAPPIPSTAQPQPAPVTDRTEPAPVTAPPAAPVAGADKPAAAEAPVRPKEKIARKNTEKKRAPATDEATAARPAAGPIEPSVATLRELPEQIQREIPSYTIGGYIYSGNRADRSVLANKRLLREGDEIAPGLVIEQMMPNGMVLNYRGYRYRASY